MLIVLLWLFRRKSRPTLCDPMAAHQASLFIVSSLGSHHWTILSSWGADRLVWIFVNLVKDTPFDFPEYKLLPVPLLSLTINVAERQESFLDILSSINS